MTADKWYANRIHYDAAVDVGDGFVQIATAQMEFTLSSATRREDYG